MVVCALPNVHVWSCVKFTEALIMCHRAFITYHVTSVGFTSFITWIKLFLLGVLVTIGP